MKTSHVRTYWFARARLREYAARRADFLGAADVRRQFDETRDQIAQLLGDAEWWHGTGTRKYVPVAGSKYAGACTREAQDVLPSLLTGLRPCRDLYVDEARFDNPDRTVSLTRTRMYAKGYALRHFCEGESLEYEFGSRDFWYHCITTRMGIEALRRRAGLAMIGRMAVARVRAMVDRQYRTARHARWRARRDQMSKWSSDIRADARDVLHSDIPGNTPVLIGVRRGVVRPLAVGPPTLALYESRADGDIPAAAFTHLEVPLARVHTIRAAVEQVGLRGALPVVPIEFADLVQSECDFEELVRPDLEAAAVAHARRRVRAALEHV